MALVIRGQLLAREDVSQVSITASTNDLDSLVALGEVGLHCNGTNVAAVKRRPAAATLKLGRGRKERVGAAAADEVALRRVEAVVLAGALPSMESEGNSPDTEQG